LLERSIFAANQLLTGDLWYTLSQITEAKKQHQNTNPPESTLCLLLSCNNVSIHKITGERNSLLGEQGERVWNLP
jgi:hypothetical protein